MNDINEKLIGKVLVLSPQGSLDIMTYQKLKQRLGEAIDSDRIIKMVLDMEGVEYVASSGWAIMISQARRLRRIGGSLALCAMGPDIRHIYDTMSIETILPCDPDIAAAVERVSHD